MPKKPEAAVEKPLEVPEHLELFTVLINGMDFTVRARDRDHLAEVVAKMRTEIA
jgi:hypothetical protein